MATKEKVYIINLWQTKGIKVYEKYEFYGNDQDREFIVIHRPGTGINFMAKIDRDAFFSLEEAQAAVEVERIKAIDAAEKRLEKLRKMEIKVTEEGT